MIGILGGADELFGGVVTITPPQMPYILHIDLSSIF